MSKKRPYISQYVSPNIVIVPTVCCFGPPPKKPKLDTDVPIQPPHLKLEDKVSNQPVKNQTSENSAPTDHERHQNPKKSMPTPQQNELLKSFNEKDINKNSSAVQNLNKTTKQSNASWATNYLQSIGQLHKNTIKLNLSTIRKKRNISKEGNQPSTSNCNIMNSSKEPQKSSSSSKEEGRNDASTLDYQKPFRLQNTSRTPTFSSREVKVSSEYTGTLVNQINTDTKRIKYAAKPSSTHAMKSVIDHDKIIKPQIIKTLNNTNNDYQIALSGFDNKSNIDNNKKRLESQSNKQIPIHSPAILRNTKSEEKRKRDLSETKNIDFNYLKLFNENFHDTEIKKLKDKNKRETFTTSKTLISIKNKFSQDSKSRIPATKSTIAQSKSERPSKPQVPNFSSKSCISKPPTKSTIAQSKSELAVKHPLPKFSEKTYLTVNKHSKTKSSKPTKILRVHEKEEKYHKKLEGSTKIKNYKKDHSESTAPKSQEFATKKKYKKDTQEKTQEFGIKKKYKKDTLEKKDRKNTTSQNLKSSKMVSSSSKIDSFDGKRSSSKDSIKSVVQVAEKFELENSVNYKQKIDENFDLRTKLSHKGLNHYFTKICNESNRESKPRGKRENLIITVQNDGDQLMKLNDVHKTSPVKDSTKISESKECTKIKVVINLICNQSTSNKPDENSGLSNEDLSFLDDLNVDEIVETLKHTENESHGTPQNVELDIEVHTGLEKTKPVSLDSNKKGNDILHETMWNIERSYIRGISQNCSAENMRKHQSVQYQTTQIPNIKTEDSDELHSEKINNVDPAVDTIATTVKVNQQMTAINNTVQLEGTDNMVRRECVGKLNKENEKRVDAECKIFNNKMPLIVNIKKEPGFENNDLEESDKASEKERLNAVKEDNESSLLKTVRIKSEPLQVLSEFTLSNSRNNLILSEKLSETGSNKEAKEKPDDDLPEVINVDLDTTYEDDDNASVDTLVLSPPHFDDISLIDLSNELNIENVSEIENRVKKEIIEIEINAQEHSTGENSVKTEIYEIERTEQAQSDDLNSTKLSNELSTKNVNEKENQTTKSNTEEPISSTETIKIVPTTQNLSDDSKSTELASAIVAKSDVLCPLNTDKSGKENDDDFLNGRKIKVIKVEDCVVNKKTAKIGNPQTNKTQTPADSNGTASLCSKSDENKLKDKQQESKMPLPVNVCESDKVLVQNLEHRMLSYLNEQYTITSVIHKGKFSEIFHCKNACNKDFAVKVIKCEFDRLNLGILKEKMLMQLQKEIPRANYHCAYIFNGFSLTGFWCFLMEYYPKNLLQVIKDSKKPFHIDEVQHLARQLVAAVTVLRNNNIVHSDIRPNHILLNHSNTRLKLCGFDSSYYIGGAKLLPNIGTSSYRAPEIILGFSAGFSIDVWSTAVVLYEMVTGMKLFPGTYNNDILYKQMYTMGNIPFDMVKNSFYKDNHFCGPNFIRRIGAGGKQYVAIYEFTESNRLRGTIFDQYNRCWGKTKPMRRLDNLQKLEALCNLLENMLVLHPNYRLPIEFVYSNPFIYNNVQHFNN